MNTNGNNTGPETGGSIGLSIVVPAYNEEDRISDTLPAIWSYADQHFASFELLVVDDGSSDSTASIVEEFARTHAGTRLVTYGSNQGKGHAVRTGMLEARGEMALFSDADLATPIAELENLLAKIHEGCDVAIASRTAKGAELVVRQPWYRELAGRTFNLLVQLVAVPGVHDTQCGFKLFRRAAYRDVFSHCQENGFAFDIEVLHVALSLGHKVAEVPVHWMHREGSKVRLVRDGVRMLIALLRITRRHRRLQPTRHESC